MGTKGTAQVMAEKNLGEEKAHRYHKLLTAQPPQPFEFTHEHFVATLTPAPPNFIHTTKGLFFEARSGGIWANWDEVCWLALAVLSQEPAARNRLPKKAGMSCYSFWNRDVDYGVGPKNSTPRLLRKKA